jgi:hypothetical protein
MQYHLGMDISPFPYHGPLHPQEVRGRDELLADLTRQVTSRKVTALLGPRRFGKTSVLRRLASDLREVATVWVDLYGVTSLPDVAAAFDDALAATPAAFHKEATAVAAKLQLSVGVARAELSRPARDRPDAYGRLTQLLQVFTESAQRHPALLMLDEFSSIADVGSAAEVLRTQLQHHYRDFGLVFAGSQVSTMNQLFAARSQPFYGQADMRFIGPLDRATVTGLVHDGFASTGRDPGNVASLVYGLTGGHPQRTMLLVDAVWQHTAEGEVADDSWAAGLEQVRAAARVEMPALYDPLPSTERKVLRLIANGQPLFGAAAERVNLTKGSVDHARRRLIAKGHVDQAGDRCVDPLLADWTKRTMPL